MSEDFILKEIKSGNQKTLGMVYQKYRNDFIQWAYNAYRCSQEDGKEIYQLSFFIFYDNIKTGKLENLSSNIKTYIFAIGKNKILEMKRRNARYGFDINEEILSMEEESEIENQKEEQYKKITEGLRQLGNPCKKILEMMYYENRNMDFISERMGYKNANTAKNQKYKCLQRLKKIVEGVKV
ncbi:hypothetical protein GCM10027284_46350 [Cyclobacterium sediminis]